MPTTFDVSRGLLEFTRLLDRLPLARQGVTELLRKSGPYLVGDAQMRFRESIDPYGVPWAPLKSRQGKPLLDTGALRNSISFQVQGDTLLIGPHVGYGLMHQVGATIPPHTIFPTRKKALAFMVGGQRIVRRSVKHPGSRIPARPFLPDQRGLPDRWRDIIAEQIRRHLVANFSG